MTKTRDEDALATPVCFSVLFAVGAREEEDATTSQTSLPSVPATNAFPAFGEQSSPTNTGGAPDRPSALRTGVAEITDDSFKSPFFTSQAMTCPSAPALSSVSPSARRRRHRTPWCVGGPSTRVTLGPGACARTRRVIRRCAADQTAMEPSGVPVSTRPLGKYTADTTACFLHVGPNLPDSSTYSRDCLDCLPEDVLRSASVFFQNLTWLTP